ncbi:uncharacterized protein EV422DRAFT_42744 [Fimicolochytrium jonesii]|uniref:uncharacterized protein n=1 Tax=Fimicolochytrium jonesii TaxID=1396493 RepID=UPI0022FE51A4|nr:uncharacterized protein EV422DRAFT_42744 [Fimicolochytrium jonesii]KAI8821444.1 hypothetical protein EV422DRAFT_42744 [Fimicolochytrium jonesii]
MCLCMLLLRYVDAADAFDEGWGTLYPTSLCRIHHHQRVTSIIVCDPLIRLWRGPNPLCLHRIWEAKHNGAHFLATRLRA